MSERRQIGNGDDTERGQRRSRLRLWLSAVLGAVLLIALLFPVLAPRIIDLSSVRARIEARLSEAIGGTVAFDWLDVRILPRPRVKVANLRMSVPGRFQGTAVTLSVYPKILPLFVGKLRASKVTVEAPEVAVRLSAPPAQEPRAKRPDTLAALKRSLAEAGSRLAALAPNLTIVIDRGRAVVSTARHPPVTIERLDARIVLPPRGFRVRLDCRTTFWKDLSVDAKLDPRTLAAEGSLEIEGFKPHLLNPYLFPDGNYPVGDSLVDLDLSFRTDEAGNRLVKGKGTASMLRLLRGGKTLLIEGARFAGAVAIDARHTTITVDDLQAASPRLEMNGELRYDAETPRAGMTLTGSNIDVRALRHAVLFFTPDRGVAQTIFDVLRAGVVPSITFASSGRTPSDLVDMKEMHIAGSLQNGTIDVPGTPLHLTGVGGNVVIAGGVLQANGLSAQLGHTTGQNGTLRLGLLDHDIPFHLDMTLTADLAELPPVLKALVKNPTFQQELDLLREVNGTARGRLVLGETLRSMSVTVDVSAFELRTAYQRVPFPIQLSGGRFLLSGTTLSLEHVRGMFGRSSVSELAARLDLRGGPHVQSLATEASLSLDELYPWLSSFPAVGQPLKDIVTLRGTVLLSMRSTGFPLAEPGAAQFTASGRVNNVTVDLKNGPGPLTVLRGGFTADRGTFAFTNAYAEASDASLHLGGRMDNYLSSARTGTFTVTGTVGGSALQWVSQLLAVPPEYSIKPPLSLSSLRLSWQGRDALAVAGTVAFPKGPSVTIDMLHDPRRLTINTLRVQDGDDQVNASLKFEQRTLDLAVAGTLREDTLTKVFANERLLHGRLSGDFQSHVPLDRPRESTAYGTLEGKRLPLPIGLTTPAIIEYVALRADGRTITADAANISIGSSHVSFTGTAAAAPGGYAVDGDLAVDRIDLDAVRAALRTEQTATSDRPAGKQPSAGAGNFPLRGTVRMRADAITSGRLTAAPVLADITIAGSKSIRAVVRQASLCGLSVTGSAAVTGNEAEFDLQAAAAGQELESTMVCLSEDRVRTTGVFDLKVHLTSRGQEQALVNKLGGTVEFTARNGKIHRAVTLMRVLALLNITELLRGKLPDPGAEGIAYNTMRLRGTVQNGILQVSEAVIDGSAITVSGTGAVDIPKRSVDAMFLIAPFKTFDAIINAIPGLRYIMGGSLIAVPVRLQGPLAEPEVTVMKPADVGDQLVGLTTRVLKLPFKIVEPILPGGTKEP